MRGGLFAMTMILLFCPKASLADCLEPDINANLGGTAFFEDTQASNEENGSFATYFGLKCRHDFGITSFGLDGSIGVTFYDEEDDVVRRGKLDLHQAYVSYLESAARINAGIYDFSSGHMEAQSSSDRAYQRDFTSSFLFPERNGVPMLHLNAIADSGTSFDAAIIEPSGLTTLWPENGQRGSLSQLSEGQTDIQNNPAIFLQAMHLFEDMDLGANLWSGPARDPRFTFNSNTYALDIMHPEIQAISLFGEYVMADQSLRFDFGAEYYDDGRIINPSVGYIRYFNGIISQFATHSAYVEYYHTLDNSSQYESVFNKDLVFGLTSDLSNSGLTSIELRTMHDLENKDLMSAIKIGHDFSEKLRGEILYQVFNIPDEDSTLQEFNNDNSISVHFNVTF